MILRVHPHVDDTFVCRRIARVVRLRIPASRDVYLRLYNAQLFGATTARTHAHVPT